MWSYSEWALNNRHLWAFLGAGLLHLALYLALGLHLPHPKHRSHLPIDVVLRASPSPSQAVIPQTTALQPTPKAPPRPESVATRERIPVPDRLAPHPLQREPVAKAPTTAAKSKTGAWEKTPSPPLGKMSNTSSANLMTTRAPAETMPPKNRLDLDLLGQQVAELSRTLSQPTPGPAATLRKTTVETIQAPRYKARAYEQAWQSKVERIGNLNYPDVARKNKLSGTLKLSVSLNPDGSIHSIEVRQSSGHPELDEAAAGIVRLAAPYARFPDELRTQTDILVITRTWRFYDDFRLATAP